MVADVSGIIFSQVYTDNTGGPEFDTDGDGNATQEDEFVSVQNTTGAPVDISGFQIWTESGVGTGGADSAQVNDGLYHTFPPGTVLQPGETLYIINEITGTPASWMQEASEGGVESAEGSGPSTNFLSEGDGEPNAGESLALVDPASGDYIIFNMSGNTPSDIESGANPYTGFPGTNKQGEDNAALQSGQEDPGAGFSYRYNAATDSYDYQAVSVPCFTAGTHIKVPTGEVAVETLAIGDLVETYDHGPQPIRAILTHTLDFEANADPRQKPIEFKPDSLGAGRPSATLMVSPQHRMLVLNDDGQEHLVPAKALLKLNGVRQMTGKRQVSYIHLVFGRHEIVFAEGAWSESLYVGSYITSASAMRTKRELLAIFPLLQQSKPQDSARPFITVGEYRRALKACQKDQHSTTELDTRHIGMMNWTENDAGLTDRHYTQ